MSTLRQFGPHNHPNRLSRVVESVAIHVHANQIVHQK